MRQSQRAGETLLLQLPFPIAELAHGLADVQAAVPDYGHAGRIIPPVFQPFEAIQKNAASISMASVSDYATHDFNRRHVLSICAYRYFFDVYSIID